MHPNDRNPIVPDDIQVDADVAALLAGALRDPEHFSVQQEL